MELILHLGEGKTGTTSIQKFLSAHASKLLDMGIAYTTDEGVDNHVCLAARLGVKVRVSGQETAGLKIRCDELFQSIQQQVKTNDLRAVILSVEHIFMLDPLVILDYLKRYFDIGSIHVIAYIRDPVSQYVSRMQQRIKASFLIVQPHLYARDVYSPVRTWVEQLGVHRVHVKPFSRDSLVSSDVLVDFLSQVDSIVGCDLAASAQTSQYQEHARLNSGINVEQMSTVQCFRRIVYPGLNNVLQRRSSRLVTFFERLNGLGFLGTKPRLKSDVAALILARNSVYIDSLALLYPQFKSIQRSLEASREPNSLDANADISKYVSIVDLFVDRSAAVLDFYRFFCLPLRTQDKSPSVYLNKLSSLLDRCDCQNQVSDFIGSVAEKAVSQASMKGLANVEIF
jgi:hypothetical protein